MAYSSAISENMGRSIQSARLVGLIRYPKLTAIRARAEFAAISGTVIYSVAGFAQVWMGYPLHG